MRAMWVIARPSLFIIAVLSAYLLPGVIGHDPWKQDEAYTFGIVLHILESGDWVVPTLGGQPFMEKPPLFYASAAAMAALAAAWLPLHDGARLAATGWIGVGLLMTALAAGRLNGPPARARASLIVVSTVGLLTHAHEMITDTALFAGFAIAIYGLTWSRESALRTGIWLGTGAGVGFLAKGLVEPAMIGLACCALPIVSLTWRTPVYRRGLAWAAAFALPWIALWPAALYARNPEAFNTWFWTNNLGRFLGTAHLGADSEPFYYLRVLPWFTFPVAPLAVAAVMRWWRSGGARAHDCAPIVLPCTVAGAMLVVLVSAATVRSLYALPLIIPLSILASRESPLLTAPWIGRLSRLFACVFAALAVLIWGIWAYGVTYGRPPNFDWLLRWLPEAFEFRFDPLLFTIAAVTTSLCIAGWVCLRSDPSRYLYRWVAGIAMIWGSAMSLLLPWLDEAKSFRKPFLEIAAIVPPDECVAQVGLGEPQRGMLHYVAGIVAAETGSDLGECGYLLVQNNHRHERAEPVDPDWLPVWTGARPGERDESFTLFERETGLLVR